MTRSTVFKSNRSQAVRLPKPVAFPEGVREVEIVRAGQTRIISPAGKRWDELFDKGARVSDDFMNDRYDSRPDAREPL